MYKVRYDKNEMKNIQITAFLSISLILHTFLLQNEKIISQKERNSDILHVHSSLIFDISNRLHLPFNHFFRFCLSYCCHFPHLKYIHCLLPNAPILICVDRKIVVWIYMNKYTFCSLLLFFFFFVVFIWRRANKRQIWQNTNFLCEKKWQEKCLRT